MNPHTNRFEELVEAGASRADAKKEFTKALQKTSAGLIRSDGTPVPKTWTQFTIGEHVVIKDYTFKVAYIGETNILFEPVGVPILTKED